MLPGIAIFVAVVVSVVVSVIFVAAIMVASAPRAKGDETDVFGFDALRSTSGPSDPSVLPIPPLLRYAARDGEQLAYRFYDSTADQLLIFIHGSSYHGSSYHDLAIAVSSSGAAKVVLPNLRGHFQSGRRRGDVEYVGQLEDDVADLVAALRQQGCQGAIVLGGHSSGGGFAIRFAGGTHAQLVSRYMLLSPVIPTSSTLRNGSNGSSGGWARLHLRRLIGLIVLNALGLRGLNALPVIEFNKPVRFWDGTETLSYSYRLNASYHPRSRYVADVRKLAVGSAIFIGEHDEAVDAGRLAQLVTRISPEAGFQTLAGINHFGIFMNASVHDVLIEWLSA